MNALPNPLAIAAATRPQHEALVEGATRYTYQQLCEYVMDRACEFAEHGVQNQTRVFFHRDAGLQWVIDFYALCWIGACPVIPPRDIPDEQLNICLKESGATRAIASASLDVVMLPLYANFKHRTCDACDWNLDDTRMGLFTSGSTGRNRLILLPTKTLYFSAMGSMLRLGNLPSDRWLVCLPFDHIGGIAALLRCAWGSLTAYLMTSFDAARVIDCIEKEHITMVSWVPSMLVRILHALNGRILDSSLRVALIGGASCPVSLRDKAADAGIPVQYSWGMTETGSQIATTWPDDPSRALFPLPFYRVWSDDHVLWVDGPGFDVPLKTADRGDVDEHGVHIFGRSDDVIISGGEKIHPEHVTNILLNHSKIHDAVVTGFEHNVWGQEVVAFVVSDEEPEVLRTWCKQHLPVSHVPRHIVCMNSFPINARGKIDHHALSTLFHHGANAHAKV